MATRWIHRVLIVVYCCCVVSSTAHADNLAAADVVPLIPDKVYNKQSWANDVVAALHANGLPSDRSHVCGVLAIIGQESGFHANPGVKNLSRIARERLDAYASNVGPLGSMMVGQLLKGRARPNEPDFETRLKKVRTERDLDRLFRDILHYHETASPKTYAVANAIGGTLFSRRLQEMNPITTAGAMQVSVRFAHELANRSHSKRKRKRVKDEYEIREELYTQRGGVYYGTARLFGYVARYSSMAMRFADYNAGMYSSRNAALQEQVGVLAKTALALDGDLLVYDQHGEALPQDSRSLKTILRVCDRYAPELSEKAIRRDLSEEKTAAFEQTATYQAIKAAYQKTTGKRPVYARIPDVAIHSPKLAKEYSSAWFSRAVTGRYNRCMAGGNW